MRHYITIMVDTDTRGEEVREVLAHDLAQADNGFTIADEYVALPIAEAIGDLAEVMRAQIAAHDLAICQFLYDWRELHPDTLTAVLRDISRNALQRWVTRG